MSMRKAINEMCRQYIYDPMGGNGNWRQQVTKCTSPGCPLYELRPQTNPKTKKLGTFSEI